MKEQPEKKLTRQKKWSDAHPQKTWAHSALRSALRRGLIERKPCEVCGAEKAEGHHPDYDRPMLVKWLCAKHHKEEHRRIKGGADAQP
ncbi:hypothetical protein [Neorhizobium sp. DAR64860/K0K1]|uniref:hypothetical protein n=1 Tax=Neorhizobium sp. DAR64860/K0K1 TaxID=3421955 RepID=UPI003D296460